MAQFRGAGVCPQKREYGLEKLHHRSDEHAYGRALRNKQRIRLAVEQVFAEQLSPRFRQLLQEHSSLSVDFESRARARLE